MASSVLSNITLAGRHLRAADDIKRPSAVDEGLYALAVESTRVVTDFLSWPGMSG